MLLIGNNPFSLRIESFPDKVTKLTNLTVLDWTSREPELAASSQQGLATW